MKSPHIMMTLGLLFAGACNPPEPHSCEPRKDIGEAGAFWGAAAGSTALWSLDFMRCNDEDRVRIFLTDARADGRTEYFEGAVVNGHFELTSSSGRARVDARLAGDTVQGTISVLGGPPRGFFATPAMNGSGFYEVSVSADGTWYGTSFSGATLQAHQEGNFVVGVITDASGEQFEYRVHDLTRVFGEATPGAQPDDYLMVLAPGGVVQMGRGGGDRVKRGDPGQNVIRLDLPVTEPTPGIFFGRVQRDTDVLLFDFEAPAIDGTRKVRVYVSDGEPEPEGDIEWFTGQVSGDSFELTSASGHARLVAQVSADGISGTVTYADQIAHAYFAPPAGEGAGIYMVTVDEAGRITGSSEEGGVLNLTIEGVHVAGTITSPNGMTIDYSAHDLVRAFGYPNFEEVATVPGTYLAFAAPHGRFLVGRSGNVIGGSAGLAIIGLDKASSRR